MSSSILVLNTPKGTLSSCWSVSSHPVGVCLELIKRSYTKKLSFFCMLCVNAFKPDTLLSFHNPKASACWSSGSHSRGAQIYCRQTQSSDARTRSSFTVNFIYFIWVCKANRHELLGGEMLMRLELVSLTRERRGGASCQQRHFNEKVQKSKFQQRTWNRTRERKEPWEQTEDFPQWSIKSRETTGKQIWHRQSRKQNNTQ